MACTITIDAATIIATPGSDGDVVKIEVEGDVEGCEELQVWVEDSNGNIIVQKVVVQPTSNGHWTATFIRDQHFGKGIRCRQKTIFHAECTKLHDGKKCKDDEPIDLPCKPGGTAECPDVTITITPAVECVGGRRTVHFRADVTSANDATYTWFFGTDEDNQPGEDNETGDGSGNIWLPAPNSDGVRIVETDHVYEATSDQPQTITVRLITSAGPNAECSVEQTFTLDPCKCDVTVSLRVLNSSGRPQPTDECLPPGNYTVEVTSPTTNATYEWSVDGTSDPSQTTRRFDFSLVAGEDKTISISVEQGSCGGSNGVRVRGCEDCSNYDVQLRVIGSNRENVTDEDCLPPGDYTVQATSPTGAGNTFKWRVDNVEDTAATGTTLQVNLGNDDEKIVTLEATRGQCRGIATVVLETCPVEENDTEENGNGICDPCCIWFIINIIAVFATLVVFVVAGCVFQWAEPISITVAIGLAAAVTVSMLAWGFFCNGRSGGSCTPILRWIDILDALAILAGIVALLVGVTSPCAIAFWINVGFLQWIRRILQTIAALTGCLPNPWFRLR